MQWSGRSRTRLDPVTPGFSLVRGQVQTLVLKELEGASGFRLVLEDVNDQLGRVSNLDGSPVACLDENDAIELASREVVDFRGGLPGWKST